jgi:hypothetical protein
MRLSQQVTGSGIFLGCILGLILGASLLLSKGDILGGGYSDLPNIQYGLRAYARSCLRNGEFPAWNPHTFCGGVFAANPETGIFYPLNLPFWVLPLPAAFNLTIALHLWLGGVFACASARKLGCGLVPALISGLVFMLGAPYFSRLQAGHIAHLFTICWLPLLFGATEDALVARSGWRAVCRGGIALALMILAGGVQYVFFSLVFLGLYAAARIQLASHQEPGTASRLARWWAVAVIVALGIGLSSIQTALTSAAVRESSRAKVTEQYCGSYSFPPTGWLTCLIPNLLGARIDAPYWGPGNPWEMNAYIGMMPLVFVMVAVGAGLRPYRTVGQGDLRAVAATRALVIAGGVCLVLAAGRHTPLFGFLYRVVPGFNLFRGWSKCLAQALLAAALLAGLGLQRLLDQDSTDPRGAPRNWRWVAAALSVLICGLWFFCVSANPPGIEQLIGTHASLSEGILFRPAMLLQPRVFDRLIVHVTRQTGIGLTCLLLGSGLLSRALRRDRAAGILLWACLGVVSVDLGLAAFSMVDQFSSEILRPPSLSSIREANRHQFRVELATTIAHPSTSSVLGDFLIPLGTESLHSRRVAKLVNALNGDPFEADHTFLEIKNLQRAGPILGIRYTVTDSGVRPVAADASRVRLCPGARVLPTERDVWDALRAPGWDPATEVLLSRAQSKAQPMSASGRITGAQATVLEENASQLVVETNAPVAAHLYVADTWNPGWTAEVDGVPHVVEVANFAFRSVAVPGGRHRVVFRYDAPGLKAGTLVTLVAAAIWILLWRRRDQ